MIEYILVLAVLLAVTAASGYLIRAIMRQTERTSVLMNSDYP